MTKHVIHRRCVRVFWLFILSASAGVSLAQTESRLVEATSDGSTVNVTIPVFDPGIPDDRSTYRDMQVFPRIREIEARLIPFVLREAMVKSDNWGAVRVVTEADDAAELQVFGTIIRSDGDSLRLRIRAVDAAGYTWLDEMFSGTASDETVAGKADDDAPRFQAVYSEISSALANVRDQIGDRAVANIKGTSLMQYAVELVPSAFSGYIKQNDDGTRELLRLPARNDPMLRRIETIRNTEFVITDTIDTKFKEFSSDLAYTYRVWRDYRRKLVEYQKGDVQFARSRSGQYPPGSWESIKHQYDAYKFHRFTEQEQDRLAVAFNTEVSATVERMETRLEELNGWVEQGYEEWRGLLEELHELESLASQP